MTTARCLYSRPDKGNDAETVLYEIDLLRFARDRLLSPQPSWTEGDEWVYLEDFLLHYRNLLEFFGNPRPRDTDLTIKRPSDFWAGRVPDDRVLGSMANRGLWEKYDTSSNPGSISKYLHHCTKQRTVKKQWDVNSMYEDLRPIIERFESLLPAYKPATVLTHATKVGSSLMDGNSTASTRIFDPGLDLAK